jgi:prophage maintenance system killer protein
LRYWDIRDDHDSLAGKPGHADIEPGQVGSNEDLGAAAQQPFLALSSGEVYPDPWLKAAIAIRVINQRHAFIQGNKRTSWLYAVRLLGQFGITMPPEITFDYVRPLIKAVALGKLTDEVISGCLVDFYMNRYDVTQPVPPDPGFGQ